VAVVLRGAARAERVSHVVLHQGKDRFTYGIHVGALTAGEELTVRVSPLTAAKATKSACLSSIALTPDHGSKCGRVRCTRPCSCGRRGRRSTICRSSSAGRRAGRATSSRTRTRTAAPCALVEAGATGVKSEIARWGRGLDMEGGYSYGGAGSFGRLSRRGGSALPRLEGAHPVLYYGDGPQPAFRESRRLRASLRHEQ